METVRMSENILMRIYHWIKQNKVDGVWFNSLDDNYIKVSLVKKGLVISHAIRIKDFYTDYPYDYIEYLAKELNEEVSKTDKEK